MTSCGKPVLCFTAAVFDLLHEGHINLLEKMRQRGDLTLVILHDGFTTFRNKHKLPIEDLNKRTRNLIDTGLVDIIWHTFSEEPIKQFNAVVDRFGKDWELVFMRGDDWKAFPGRGILDLHGVPIEFLPYTKGVSSTSVRMEL